MKIIAVTQARSGSKRFPKKILNKINGKSLLEIHINRIKKARLVDEIIIATTVNPDDEVIREIAKFMNVKYYSGSENDVLDRFYKSVETIKPDYIIRLTSDCTLIDPNLIDEVISYALEKNLDYYSNVLIPSYPDGQDIEIIKFNALEIAWKESKLISDREHVTPYIKNNSTFLGKNIFTSDNHLCEYDYNKVRMVVDYFEDLIVIKFLIEALGEEATWLEYTEHYLFDKKINSNNFNIKRNEGYLISKKNDSK